MAGSLFGFPKIVTSHASKSNTSRLGQHGSNSRNLGRGPTQSGCGERDLPQPKRRGAFVDVKTIAAALTAKSFSLATLADFLATKHRKLAVDEHGAAITAE